MNDHGKVTGERRGTRFAMIHPGGFSEPFTRSTGGGNIPTKQKILGGAELEREAMYGRDIEPTG
jgi:hypothetical protein